MDQRGIHMCERSSMCTGKNKQNKNMVFTEFISRNDAPGVITPFSFFPPHLITSYLDEDIAFTVMSEMRQETRLAA